MNSSLLLILFYLFLMVLLGWSWSRNYGVRRSMLATACRFVWLSPILLALFPENVAKQIPRGFTLKPVFVFIDDSESMKIKTETGVPLEKSLLLVESLKKDCLALGCQVKESRLSQYDDMTSKGFSPLSFALPLWLQEAGPHPWVLLSDGGDYTPTIPWKVENAFQKNQGLILSQATEEKENVWVVDTDLPKFSFVSQPIQGSVRLERSRALSDETFQVQVIQKDSVLFSTHVLFEKGQKEQTGFLQLSPLSKGNHLLEIKVLPTAEEKSLWDNQVFSQVEVLPDTMGVLHLLGEPSWDGRFLRTYFKSEPKYDVVSFFILRDPWDKNDIDERKLSLIPFPAERLFSQELPKFRVVVMQNFALLQFLQPDYQKNLVDYVKNGGSLMFLGGPRALLDADVLNSPLKEILPFKVKDPQAVPLAKSNSFLEESQRNYALPWYDDAAEFTVELAAPKGAERSMASLYDDWEKLAEPLKLFSGKGLHHMEHVALKEGEYTPLLWAKIKGPTVDKVPLAIASYPGKGRAVWMFTDNLWRLGMSSNQEVSREVYYRFIHSSMTWLLHQELRKPLIVSDFSLAPHMLKKSSWKALLQGPVVRHLSLDEFWEFTLCGEKLQNSDLELHAQSQESIWLSGKSQSPWGMRKVCELSIKGRNSAFGEVTASALSNIPTVYNDREISGAPKKLRELEILTKSLLVEDQTKSSEELKRWLYQHVSMEEPFAVKKEETEKNYYWFLNMWWMWLCLLALPLEVVVRRWSYLHY